MVEDISQLHGQVIGSGATNIIDNSSNIVTLKCSSCGAEVVIDTSTSTSTRCHWCKNTLSINQKVPNGTVPDIILPFDIKRESAMNCIEGFVKKRKFFAHPKFLKNINLDNIMGVYFPYIVVDINAHSTLIGEGEHQTGSYTVKKDDDEETYYEADIYHVERDFDIAICDLTVQSSMDKLNMNAEDKTNNIINYIMPFDIEHSIKYKSEYMKGYTSEKRDVNIDDLRLLVSNQSKDIARFAANETLKYYNRGVRWDKETINMKGQQWKAAYLPIWLYSYQEVKGDKKVLHYVAVNARTKETMGSIPIYKPKLIAISLLIELPFLQFFILAFFTKIFIFLPFLLLPGIIFYLIMCARYRNSSARHYHETETYRNVSNMVAVDQYLRNEDDLESPWMIGSNNNSVKVSSVSSINTYHIKKALEQAEKNISRK